DVLATDLPAGDPRAKGWSRTAQHASRAEQLYRPSCPRRLFDRHVQVRPVDMKALPDDLTGFDFVWSSCALEHLGSLEAGTAFVKRSLGCLRPGGIAVHTTEFNLTSNEATTSEGPTVAYRMRDIEALLDELRARGHQARPFLIGERHGVLDRIIDIPPYTYSALLVRLGPHVLTSAILVIRVASPEMLSGGSYDRSKTAYKN
ncbi:MAG TPA: class I SAM-dependent methyltransferase, partial [Acidobacteriaceae bacterium]|nr:class I SAM-dependent methyltransferase [Acidobacteriaceae bacterium]